MAFTIIFVFHPQKKRRKIDVSGIFHNLTAHRKSENTKKPNKKAAREKTVRFSRESNGKAGKALAAKHSTHNTTTQSKKKFYVLRLE